MSETGRVIRAAELVAVPWPNGLGVTRDILRHADEAGELLWLLTVADLERDAPFSHLPGRDRIFTLVEGGPVLLAIGEDAPMRCRPLVPAHFPGDRPTSCRLEGGPGRAFNVMVGRGRAKARVGVHTLAAGQAFESGPDGRAVFCVEGEVRAGAAMLAAGDTLAAAPAVTVVPSQAPATILVVEIAVL